MTGPVLGLVLLAAVLHALWNLAAKHAGAGRVRVDPLQFVWFSTVLSALVCLPLAVADLVLRDAAWTWSLLAAPLVSAVLHVGYGVVLQTGYQRADLGLVYPVARGVGPLLTVVVAVVLLGERPAPTALAGGLLVPTGVLVVTGGVRRARGQAARGGVGWGTATGVSIAAYTLWDSHAVTDLGHSPVAYFGLAVTLQALLMTPAAALRGARVAEVVRASWRPAVAVALLSPAAYVLVLVALQSAPVAVVAPVRESSIVVGSLLAWWVLGEPDPLRRLAGALVVLGGIALVALG